MQIALPARLLGTQIGHRYRLDRLIGEGASAWVFAGQDLRLEREVAIKLLKPSTGVAHAASRRRFVAEGRTLARLVHPHIVLAYDAGDTEDGLGYLVMELSDSGNLEAELHDAPMAVDECVSLLLPLMGALASAHDLGVVHRDIKPTNIAFVREAGRNRAKLLDFGIARRRDAGASTGTARGTPSYMAPEQARGLDVSASVDVWAVGVLFFRCLSGRLPFEADTSLETLFKLVNERAPHFSQVCPNLGSHLAVALDRALEPDPERRYGDMRSFARALTVACTQDRLRLPREPDPIGLPDFARWVALANVESTGPAVQGAVRTSEVPATRPRLARRWFELRRGIVIALIAAGFVGGTWFGRMRNDVVSRDVVPARVSGIVSHTTVPSRAPELAAPPLQRSAESVAPTPASSVAPKPLPPAKRRKKATPAGSLEGTQPSQQDAAPATPSRKPSRLLTDWDW